MGSGNSRREDDLRREADRARTEAAAARQQVAAPDEFEVARRNRARALEDWRNGILGPVDVRRMPGSDVAMGLFRDSLQARDAGRIGRGLGVLNDGANPAYSAALGKELDAERHLQASGQLEGNVEQLMGQHDSDTQNLAQVGNSRRSLIAQLAAEAQRDAAERLNQHRATARPSFLRQMALSAISGAAGAATGAFAPRPR
ncbi:MAG TPA: hypothetical protein VIQ24_24350 [Pyrinomonadaceae bacterium]